MAPASVDFTDREIFAETSFAMSVESDSVCIDCGISADDRFEGIIGRSRALQRVIEQVAIVAPTDATVLLHGETGTGKEMLARAIHNLSPRRERSFVRMNCAAIPSGLLESELFGHEKGAFTGALMQRKGRFELADSGSLFLDEIGDISLDLQPKLLRAVQEQEFERLGSARTIQVSVRMIAATHRDLPAMIREQRFREDCSMASTCSRSRFHHCASVARISRCWFIFSFRASPGV
jgi:formate hydrogenlyase transcriptional activator